MLGTVFMPSNVQERWREHLFFVFSFAVTQNFTGCGNIILTICLLAEVWLFYCLCCHDETHKYIYTMNKFLKGELSSENISMHNFCGY